ncbi:hypothetical protein ACFZDF_15595 [Streptomyces sp. NPDC007910]|uniref:hypothetical protein n=1 Tax=unclassified Streptomyces TaxID=2593676 RepID=UPI0036F02D42
MGSGPVKARPWTWVRATVVVTVFCGGPPALLARGATAWSEMGRAQRVDCAEAMEFARCTAAHFQDTQVEAAFRTDRAGAGAWPAATCPARETAYSCEVDACVRASYDEVSFVDVSIPYEDGETALVRVRAFDL